MIDTIDNREVLIEASAEYGITVSDNQASMLLRHLDLLVEANKRLNLTRITEPHDAIVRHVIDSLLFMPSIYASAENHPMRYLDIGTGGGFPGIPIGIMTDAQGLLVDSVGKKIAAVQSFIDDLGLNERVSAVTARVESLAKEQPSRYDIVTARAVAELNTLVEYATPLLKKGGSLVVSKALISDEEIDAGNRTASIVGLVPVSRETYELPEDTGHREILVYRKDRKSKVKLPRAVGMAKHKPLA